MKKLGLVLFVLFSFSGFSQNTIDTLAPDPSVYFNKDMPIKPNKELRFIAYFFTQGVTSNYYPTNTFFQGQVIGRLFGRSTARTSDTLRTSFVEQRFLPFFLYTPKILDGKVTLRASFEIDWTWGDASYGAGGNQGAGFNADFVNIQTQNLEIEIIPKLGWAINVGLMRGFDTPYHPYRTTFDRFQHSGFRLMYWAGDMAGINVRRDFSRGSVDVGIYNLWENKIELQDDVWLAKLMGNYKISPQINLGGAIHFIDDQSSGAGGASILGQGPKSLLTEYTGAYRFNFPEEEYKTQIAWLGTFFDYNTDFIFSNHRVSGFFNYNLGSITGEGRTIADIRGFGANLSYGFRYGKTSDDVIGLDYIYTTGDEDGLQDGTYSGVITGNTWGAPGNLPISTGNTILFPSGNVVNRYMPLISDIANLGVGLNSATLSIKKAVIPHKFILSANGSFARSNAELSRGGFNMGYEANGGLIWKMKTFLELEVRGGYVWLGDFYDAPYANGDSFLPPDERLGTKPTDPWMAFAALKWLMF
ncbi:MAG TPA: hypothetical protein DDX92_10415 [Flavobacteriales bacterium]|jgi:hypothetical protein|nr:hypothetical protein [Flavobacteriales bacterium]